MILMKGA